MCDIALVEEVGYRKWVAVAVFEFFCADVVEDQVVVFVFC